MTLENISLIANLVLIVVLIIGTLRRHPPLEGQFADQAKNDAAHAGLGKRISDLRDETDKKYLTRAEFQQERHAADEMRSQILKTLSLMNEKLDTFIEMRGEVKAKLATHEAQISELFHRVNGGTK